MRRLAALLAALASALLLVLAVDARPARTDHEWFAPGARYRTYDPPTFALGTHPHDHNYVVKKWREQAGPLTWNSSDIDWGSGPLDTAVRAVIQHHQTMNGGEFANLDWQEVGEDDLPDVTFEGTANIVGECGVSTSACGRINPVFQSPENGRYIARSGGLLAGQFFFNANLQFSSNGLRSDVAHELGHLYGLADDYSENPAAPLPGGSGQSVMGAAAQGPSGGGGNACPAPYLVCYQGTPGPMFLTWITYPTSRDIERLRAFWRGIATPSASPHINNKSIIVGWAGFGGGTVDIAWQDHAWSERHVLIDYYKLDASGTSWLHVLAYGENAQIGRHDYYDAPANNLHGLHVDTNGYPNGGPGVYWVCAIPAYTNTTPTGGPGEYGEWSCTNPFNVT